MTVDLTQEELEYLIEIIDVVDNDRGPLPEHGEILKLRNKLQEILDRD